MSVVTMGLNPLFSLVTANKENNFHTCSVTLMFVPFKHFFLSAVFYGRVRNGFNVRLRMIIQFRIHVAGSVVICDQYLPAHWDTRTDAL